MVGSSPYSSLPTGAAAMAARIAADGSVTVSERRSMGRSDCSRVILLVKTRGLATPRE